MKVFDLLMKNHKFAFELIKLLNYEKKLDDAADGPLVMHSHDGC